MFYTYTPVYSVKNNMMLLFTIRLLWLVIMFDQTNVNIFIKMSTTHVPTLKL